MQVFGFQKGGFFIYSKADKEPSQKCLLTKLGPEKGQQTELNSKYSKLNSYRTECLKLTSTKLTSLNDKQGEHIDWLAKLI